MKRSILSSAVRTMVLRVLEDLDSPSSVSIHTMVRHDEWGGLATFQVRPSDYLDPLNYFLAAQSLATVKKLRFNTEAVDRRLAAVKKWWDGEKRCRLTNLRLQPYLPDHLLLEGDVQPAAPIRAFVARCRSKVQEMIGPTPPRQLAGRFGKGSVFETRGARATLPDKMSEIPTTTSLNRWPLVFQSDWGETQWGRSWNASGREMTVVRGNRYGTVPKQFSTDRSIGIEPSLNVYLQLAVGNCIRERLRAYGWDLDQAQEVHRRVARESSVSREFATLDLSNASDTVATALVKLLLPQAWFNLLNDLRSPLTRGVPVINADGTLRESAAWVYLEKFSSMGNGYTFELETLLFAAITAAVQEEFGLGCKLGKDFFVYGDDIICKDGVAKVLSSVLPFFGLEVNREKSFSGSSPFRESCGADFFNGKDVRPIYFKEIPEGPQDWIVLANQVNQLREKLEALGHRGCRSAWFSCLDNLPSGIRRLRGPKALGDAVIHDEDQQRWQIKYRNYGMIRLIQVFRPWRYRVVHYGSFSPDVVLACATYGAGCYRGGVIPRDGVQAYKVGWVPWS